MSGKPWEILQGDVRKVLKTLPSDHFDGVLSDPPYGMAFMGKRWDYYLPSVNVWTELLRVLKPGAHGVLFGGARTSHRLAVNVEDAGFELRDTIAWLYGSGLPKSLDVSKAIDKEARVSRKVVGRSEATAATGGVYGAYGRGFDITVPFTAATRQWDGWGTTLKPAHEPIILCRKFFEGTVAQNVQRWGVGALAIDGCRVGSEKRHNGSASRNEIFGQFKGAETGGRDAIGRWPTNVCLDEEAAAALDAQNGVSRFFYTSKASKAERGKGNRHPTVKPLDLIRYLAQLILPPKRRGKPRRILIPYSGSGSEIIGCLQAGWDEVVGIERELEYIQIAETRIRKGGVFSKLLRTKRRQATP